MLVKNFNKNNLEKVEVPEELKRESLQMTKTAIATPDYNDNQHLEELKIISQNLENQQRIVKQMITLKKDMEKQEERINQKITRTENLVEKISKEVTINYEEQRIIQSWVQHKADDLTNEHENHEFEIYSLDLYYAWKGNFIRHIYSKLKKYLNVVRYTAIKREDFDRAVEFIKAIEYQDFSDRELRATPRIKNIKTMERGETKWMN